MTDLDELRRALRAHEALAPDPGTVLAAATRRIRRRRTASIAGVTLAVAALAAGTTVVLDRGTEEVPPATLANSSSAVAAPDAGKVPPAPPAVSFEDGSWTLLMWSVQPHFAALHYAQAHKYGFEIDVRDGTAPHAALTAKPTKPEQLKHPQDIAWQDGPDRWIWVRTNKPVTAPDMLALLGKIGTTPPALKSPLKSLQVPDGQKVDTFTSEPETNTLVLCPDPEVRKAPLDTRCFSLTVSLASKFADSSVPGDPLPLHQHRVLGAYVLEIDSSPANGPAALKLLNSVQLNR